MPAGFGYAAIGKAVRGALSSGAGHAGRGASKMYGMHAASGSWRTAIGGDAARMTGQGLRGMSRMSGVGLSTTMGAMGGGAYGAVSSDTSILGGAAMGAGLGAGGFAAGRLGMGGYSTYAKTLGRGVSRGTAASAAMHRMGRMSSSYMGGTYNKAVNGFSAMKGRFGR